MHTEKIAGYAIEVPKGSSFSISTPDDQIKLHTITLAIAARGTGKTVALTNLMRILQSQKCLDRVFIISPTVHSNEAMLKQLNAESEDIYEEPCRESIVDIVAKVEQERQDYDEYHRKMKMYRRFLKQLSNTSAAYDNELLLTFYNGMDFEPPKHKYNGRKPVLGLLVDDCQGSELLNEDFEDEDGMQVDPAVTPAPSEPPRGLPADATADPEDEEEEEDEPSPAFNIHSATFESQKFDEDEEPAQSSEDEDFDELKSLSKTALHKKLEHLVRQKNEFIADYKDSQAAWKNVVSTLNKNYEENISDESAREEIYNVGLSFVALFAARSSTTPLNIDDSFQPLDELIHSALPKMLGAMTLPAKVESLKAEISKYKTAYDNKVKADNEALLEKKKAELEAKTKRELEKMESAMKKKEARLSKRQKK
mmetsp:Transcript_10632/g.34953  ORF Transcript_10632/g.34953 Transcript_10632/m.34953 type:complete len:424 (+) Transcript_10632:1130-2401(+)